MSTSAKKGSVRPLVPMPTYTHKCTRAPRSHTRSQSHTRKNTNAPTRTRAYTHAHAHAHAYAHTHTKRTQHAHTRTDLVTNMGVAHAGYPNMALAACIGSPILLVLAGL